MTDFSFEQVWLDITTYAKGKSTIKTLVHNEENDIIKIDEEFITVISNIKRKGKRRERILRKRDFRYAWTCLESKKILELNDTEPKLRHRKSIIFAFLAKSLPYVGWKKTRSKPMTIFLKNCSLS